MPAVSVRHQTRVPRRALVLPTAVLTLLTGVGSAAAATEATTATAPVATTTAATATATTATSAVDSPTALAVISAVGPTLRQGSRGAAVVTLQRRLAALRYDVGRVDGIFGYDTLHAVIAFQKVQRIGVDGIVGRVTWSRLASPTIPRPRYTSSTAAIEVNLSRRVVYVTKSGRITRILDASPGKPSTPTVTGRFTIYRQVNRWDRSPLGMLWRPNYFYRGYALHGSTSVPTYPASHGCVRVTIAGMNRLWSQLSVGERVYVYR
jgi:peptidoglycan hydrolase-like protein with peptidoglycan-binding domain